MNNEKILDIALAASPDIKKSLGDMNGKCWIAANGIRPQSVVKFTELIVRECADRATWAQDTNAKDVGGEVLKHFGVEE